MKLNREARHRPRFVKDKPDSKMAEYIKKKQIESVKKFDQMTGRDKQ